MRTGHLDGSRRTITVMGEIARTGARALLVGRGLEGAQALGRTSLARLLGRNPQAGLAELLDNPFASRVRRSEDFATAMRTCLKPAFDANPLAYRLLVDPRRLTFRAVDRAEAESLARRGRDWPWAGLDRDLPWRLP